MDSGLSLREPRNDGLAANKNPANRIPVAGSFELNDLPVRPRSDRECRGQLAGAEVVGRGLAAAAVRNDVEGDLLALVEGRQTSALNGADVNKTSFAPSSGWMKPKPFWLLNHFTVPIAIVISFQLTMHSGGQMRSLRPLSRLVDFGEIPETCSPIGNETERPSRSAKDRCSQSSDFLGQLQGGTRSWRAG
jgi:hypothetical protein